MKQTNLGHCSFYLIPDDPSQADIANMLERSEAAYVLTSTHKLFYVKKLPRAGYNLTPLQLQAHTINELVKNLRLPREFRESKFEPYIKELTSRQLTTVALTTGHVHDRNYIRELVLLFKKMESINDFDLHHKDFFINLIKHFEKFINNYLQDALTALEIYPGSTFYNEAWFTLAKRRQNIELLTLVASDLNSLVVKSNLEEVKKKLNNLPFLTDKFLSKENASIIVKGYQKLQQLLPLNNEFDITNSSYTDLGKAVIGFNASMRDNCYVDFLIENIRLANHIPGAVDQGTNKQRLLINTLKKICRSYQKHLEKGLKRITEKKETGELELAGAVSPKTLEARLGKYNQLCSMLSTLDDKNIGAREKIKLFKEQFDRDRKFLASHRDTETTLFLKNVGFILSSFFLGAGLIYSKCSKGTFNFFASHGSQAMQKIENCFEQPEYQIQYNW